MFNKQAGFILLAVSANLLLVIMLIIMVLGYFINSMSIQSRVRDQERGAFLAANYLVTGHNTDNLFVVREEKKSIDRWLGQQEIKVYKNDKLIYTMVQLISNDKKNYD